MGKDRQKVDDERVRKIRFKLVARYARKFPTVDVEDLHQVASLAEASVRRCYKPDGPARLSSIVYRAVNVALFEAVCRAHAPVYVCRHNVRQLLPLRSISIDREADRDRDEDRGPPVARLAGPDPVEELGGIEATIDRARAYRRLREVVSRQPGGREALRILLGEATVRDTARKLGVGVLQVRERKRAVVEAIRADDELRALVASL